MKKTFSILSTIALVVMGMAVPSCSKIQDVPVPDDSVSFSLSVSRGEGTKALAESGKNLAKTFAENDRIAVVYLMGGETKVAESAALQSDKIENEGKRATFNITLEGTPDEDSAMKIIYPSSLANADGSVNYAALATQDGTLDYIAANLDLGLYEGTLSGTTLPTGVALTNPLVIAKFTVKNSVGGADMTADVTQMVISDGTSIYTATPTSSQSPVWVAMNPVTAGTIELYAAKGKDLYKKTVSNVTLGANKLYPIQVTMAKVDGAVSGFFSTNAKGDKMYFSQGNLQYAQSSSTWSFMENQFSTVETYYQNVGDNYADQNIVSIFGWGTSGINHGAACYQPTSTSETTGDYYAYGYSTYSLYSSDGKADWGYNRISNGGNTQNAGWHTPTAAEWNYILGRRRASTLNGVNNARYAKACLLGSIHGVILFPDHYNHPAGVALPTGINDERDTSWNANQYSSADWAQMEAAGCVFLPAAGNRIGKTMFEVDSYGEYWSSSSYDSAHASIITFRPNSVNYDTDHCSPKYFGYSVRLAKDVKLTTSQPKTDNLNAVGGENFIWD